MQKTKNKRTLPSLLSARRTRGVSLEYTCQLAAAAAAGLSFPSGCDDDDDDDDDLHSPRRYQAYSPRASLSYSSILLRRQGTHSKKINHAKPLTRRHMSVNR